MDPPRSEGLALFLTKHYPSIKARYPGEGRRKWRLRVAEMFWSLSSEEKASYLASISQNAPSAESVEDADFSTDDDPLDAISDGAPGIGVLLRTDYSNEDAWQAFYKRLQDAEAEFASEATPVDDENVEMEAEAQVGETSSTASSAAQGAAPAPAVSSSYSTDAQGDSAMGGEDDRDADGDAEDEHDIDIDEDDAGGGPSPIIHIVNASPTETEPGRMSAPWAAKLPGISNLAALRLLNDVDVRRAPVPPPGTKRIRPPNRLVDHDGWQEVYTGKTVWIYDAKSNEDQCARLVSQKGAAMYGTATADSWRARVSHICELQVNLASGAMTIDFGGLDRWDYAERVRNMKEAVEPVT